MFDEPGGKVVRGDLGVALVEVEDNDGVRAGLGEGSCEEVSESSSSARYDAYLIIEKEEGHGRYGKGTSASGPGALHRLRGGYNLEIVDACAEGLEGCPTEFSPGPSNRFPRHVGRGGEAPHLVGHGEGGEGTTGVAADHDARSIGRVSKIWQRGGKGYLLRHPPKPQARPKGN